MGSIEPFIVLPMAALHLSVMPGRIWADEFVAYPMYFQVFLEKGWLIPVGIKPVGKFCPIVCLNTFNGTGECFYQMLHKLSGRKGAMLFKGLHKAPAGILINGGVLKEMFSDNLAAFKTGGGNKFHIYLNALP